MPPERPSEPTPEGAAPGQLRETARLIERLVAVVLFAGLLVGVGMVLYPFVTALLFGAILVITTWPLHEWLQRKGLSNAAAAFILTVLSTCGILVPVVLLAPRLGERLVDIVRHVQDFLAATPTAPHWLSSLPLIGDKAGQLWSQFAHGQFEDILSPYAETWRKLLIDTGSAVATGALQIVLSFAVAATFWLRGDLLIKEMQDIAERLGGAFARATLQSTANSVRGVAYGVVGTAVAQAVVLAIGLALAGVPGAATLGLVGFIIALGQIGTLLVIIWGGAAWWLYDAGHQGWAIFIIVWGIFVSTVDNIVRPWLVSFGTPLPLTLVFLGVLGGFFAFGFLGMFIGPTLLAVLLSLLRAWRQPAERVEG